MKHASVQTLGKRTQELLGLVARDGATALVDKEGETTAYLLDRATYDALHRRMRLLEGIARGEKAFQEGRFVTHAEAKKKLRRWLKK